MHLLAMCVLYIDRFVRGCSVLDKLVTTRMSKLSPYIRRSGDRGVYSAEARHS